MKKSSLFTALEYELPVFALLALRMLYQPNGVRFSLQTFAAFLLCGLLAYIFGYVIRGAGTELRKITLLFTAFFLGSAASGSVLFLNNLNDIQTRGYVYTNLFFILCVLQAFASAGRKGEKWIIPIACFACAAINPSFLLVYLPAVFVLLVCNCQTAKAAGENKLLAALSAAGAAAGVLIFGRDTVFVAVPGFAAMVASNWKNLVYSLAAVAPLLLVFAVLWIGAIRQSTAKGFRVAVALIIMLPGVSVAALALNTNYTDPVMAYVFTQFCFFAYFLHAKNSAFIASLKKISGSFEKNPVPLLLTLVYLAAFSVFRFNWDVAGWIGA